MPLLLKTTQSMRKIILLAALAISFTLCRSQSIVYSNYSIKAATSAYKIIGKVGRNIIVWVCTDKRYSSEILMYDDKLELTKKVTSDILMSDINPSPIFFNNNDSFCVAYQYLKNKLWQYKIASFNENGNFISEKILDSIQNFNSVTDTAYYHYKFLQSADKKTVCFAKFFYDKQNYIIKFNCNFFTEKTLHKNFVIPFDANHDWLADFLIDNNKNFLFAIHHQTDSVSQLKIIKTNFSDDYMLIVQKDFARISLQRESVRILNTNNSYIVYEFGKPEITQDSLHQNEGTFYLWRLDSGLNNNPGDSIYHNFNAENFKEVQGDVIISANGNHLIVVQNKIDANQLRQQSYNLPPRPSFRSKAPLSGETLHDFQMLTVMNFQPAPLFLVPTPIGVADKYESDNLNIISKVTLFNIDMFNKIEWTKDFTMYSKDILFNVILNGTIVVNNDKIHLIYSVTTGKKNLIKHIVISYDGAETEKNAIAWHSSNSFIINQALQIDENTIIFPTLKGNKLDFVRMNLE